LEQMRNGAKSDAGSRVDGRVETGRWYSIRIEVSGPRVRCLLDGALVHDVVLPETPVLAASAGKCEDGTVVVKIVNASDAEQPVRVKIDGGAVAAAGEEEILAAANPDDENTLDEPAKVVPVTRPTDGLSGDFTRTFPAQSVTILKLKAK
jgi:alpha-L-arabinofuranosidase